MVYRTASVSLMAHSHCTGPGQGIDQETMSFYIALCVHTTQGQSCGKVMFLHLSVSHSVHRGGRCLGRHPPPQADTPPPQADTPPGRHLSVILFTGECLARHPPPTATAADGTYPSGMHSCFLLCPSRSLSRTMCISQ